MSKRRQRKTDKGNGGPEVSVHDEKTTFWLGPGEGRGFDDPFFRQPNPFVIKTSSCVPNPSQNRRTGLGETPPNVTQGTGPMGPMFCRADYKIDAPKLQGLTNYIHAENVMIGSNNTMDVRCNGVRDRGCQDSDSDESSDVDEPEDLQEEVERKRKEQERYDKMARRQDTLHSSRPISDQEMRDVSKCLLGAWRKFLRNLDIEDEILDRHYQQYMGNGGLAEVVYQSLEYWRQNTESPEVQKVANALGRVNMWDTVSDHLHP